MAHSEVPRPDEPWRRVAISGASGFLGSALAARLRAQGITVHRMRRGTRAAPPDLAWRPESGEIDLAGLNGVDAVVNLAGAPIAKRWTERRKREILESRVGGTRLLADTVARLDPRPRVFLSGSAVGIYGSRGDEELDEDSRPGNDFLAQTAVAWEEAAAPASASGIRVLLLRTGIVLNPAGGVLAKLLLPYKFSLGGRVGSGAQWMSWIGLADWVNAVSFALTADMAGPVNLVAPNPVPNVDFVKTLARVLGRPAIMQLPERVVELLFGEMGRSTLLGSQRVHPRRLLEAGFEFSQPTLEQALRAELGRGDSPRP